jgi:hypothetical protein
MRVVRAESLHEMHASLHRGRHFVLGSANVFLDGPLMPRQGVGAGMVTAVWMIAAVASVFLLRAASQLLIPIVLAMLISYALEPIVAWLHKRRVPRIAGAGLLLAFILGFSDGVRTACVMMRSR